MAVPIVAGAFERIEYQAGMKEVQCVREHMCVRMHMPVHAPAGVRLCSHFRHIHAYVSLRVSVAGIWRRDSTTAAGC